MVRPVKFAGLVLCNAHSGSDLGVAQLLPAIRVTGISREVVPYSFEGLLCELGQRSQVISGHAKGLDLFIDLDVIDDHAAERTKRQLLMRLEGRTRPA